MQDSLTSEQNANEIAFHITDWQSDLESLIRIYDESNTLSDEEVSSILHQFLAHVPNHLAAAMKLIGYGPIEDVFEVGVLEKESEE